MPDLKAQLADYFDHVVQRVDVSEIIGEYQAGREPSGAPPQSEADKQRDDDLTFFIVPQPGECTVQHGPRRWIGVAAAVAATILVAVGVLAVAVDERDVGDVDPVLSPSVTDPPTSSEPSVVQGNAAVPGDTVRQQLSDVIATDTGLIAVGSTHTSPGDGFPYFYTDAAVWTSGDGAEWSRLPHDASVFGQTKSMNSLTRGGPGLVAVGSMKQSDDFVDPGIGAVVWTSVDGITWSLVAHDEEIFGGPGNQSMNDVAAGGPGLVAVGADGGGNNVSVNAAVWTSVDGTTWSRIPDDEAIFGGASMQSVTVGGPGLVAVGATGIAGDNLDYREATEADKNFTTDAVVWTSVDGITWSRIPHDQAIFGGSGSQEMSKVIAAGPGLVAVGWDGADDDGDPNAAVWTSVDGITWSQIPHDQAIFGHASMNSVTVGGPGLVAVGDAGSDEQPEGESDQMIESRGPENQELDGTDAVVWTSVDGITWSRIAHDDEIFGGVSDQWMTSVTADGSLLVAVGTTETGTYKTVDGQIVDGSDRVGDTVQLSVWTSSDGITWSRTAPPPDDSNNDSPLTTIRPSTTID